MLAVGCIEPRAAAAAPAGADRPVTSCRKLPPGKRLLKLNLKPDTEVADLVAWISAITCKPFVIPGSIAAAGHKVTIVSPEPLTPEDAYGLFLAALDSVGLAVYPAGGVLRIIEARAAPHAPIPVVISSDRDDAAR